MFKLFNLFGDKDVRKNENVSGIVHSASAVAGVSSVNEEIKNEKSMETKEEWISRFNTLKTLDDKLFMIQLLMLNQEQDILWQEIAESYSDILKPYCEKIDIAQLSTEGRTVTQTLNDYYFSGRAGKQKFDPLDNADALTKKYIGYGLRNAGNVTYGMSLLEEKMKMIHPGHPFIIESERVNNLSEGDKFLFAPYFTGEQISDVNTTSIQTFQSHIPQNPYVLSEAEIEIFKKDLEVFVVETINNTFHERQMVNAHLMAASINGDISALLKALEINDENLKKRNNDVVIAKTRLLNWYQAQPADVRHDIIESVCETINSFHSISFEKIDKASKQLNEFLSDMTIKQAKNSIIDPKYIFDLPEIKKIQETNINSPEADEKVLSHGIVTNIELDSFKP